MGWKSSLCAMALAAGAARAESGWRARVRAEAWGGHDSNVFHLSPSQQAKLLANDPGNVASGRFGNMRAVGDLFLAPVLDARFERANLLGKGDFTAGTALEYRRYLSNSSRSYASFAGHVQQETSKRGRLELEWSWAPSRFQRNYLVDVLDPAGKVSLDERVYRGAVYTEPEATLAYEHRLTRKRSALEASLEVALGAAWRGYRPPFEGRDERALWGAARVKIEPAPDLALGAGYAYERVANAAHVEPLILDEPDYQLDFDGDGDALDTNRLVRERVDRSCGAHQLEAQVRWRPLESLRLQGGYAFVARGYTSRERLDPAHRGRDDRRHDLSALAEYRALPSLRIVARFEQRWQTTNRPGDPEAAGDTADYAQRLVEIGVAWDARWIL